MNNILGIIGGFLIMAAYGLLGIGSLYWLWMAIQLGSFLMFVVGIFPLSIIVTAPVGAYSLLFGAPDWVFSTFS